MMNGFEQSIFGFFSGGSRTGGPVRGGGLTTVADGAAAELVASAPAVVAVGELAGSEALAVGEPLGAEVAARSADGSADDEPPAAPSATDFAPAPEKWPASPTAPRSPAPTRAMPPMTSSVACHGRPLHSTVGAGV